MGTPGGGMKFAKDSFNCFAGSGSETTEECRYEVTVNPIWFWSNRCNSSSEYGGLDGFALMTKLSGSEIC